MSDFSFGNIRESQRKYETNNYDRVNFFPLEYGDQLIDGQIYYLKRRRPPSPYALFIKDRLPQMKMENPRGDVGKFFIELGREWHYMDSQKKCEYYLKYNDEVKKYDLLKKNIPVGVNPMLMRIDRGINLHESTKRPKFWEYNDHNDDKNQRDNDNNIEDSSNGQNGLDCYEENRKDSGKNYPSEVMHTEYNEDYIKTDDHEDSLSDDNLKKIFISNAITDGFEKKYHSD
jgi:hypothetical protein